MTGYYFIDSTGTTELEDKIYGSCEPYCMTEAEVRSLSREWDVDLFEVMHEASADEIATYGIGE